MLKLRMATIPYEIECQRVIVVIAVAGSMINQVTIQMSS